MTALGRATLFAALATLALGTACASAPRGGGNTRQDLLTREQIMSVNGASNLFEVVQRLRPRWLETRGGDRSFGLTTEVVVFQNQSYLGSVETLAQLGPEVAYEMRWLDGPTASATLPGLGSRHVAGAIVISTSPPDDR